MGSEEEDFQVEVELEDVLDKIISSLSDSDTVVRWSAAKGVGRISMRLPKSYANEVVGAVLGDLQVWVTTRFDYQM